jgi:L-asparaginase
MTVERMWALRERIAQHAARSDVQGIVVTHGTDGLEETAYLVARSVETDKPIVFTGAMRTSSDLGWDGPANISAAVRVASTPTSREQGTMVVLADRIYSALDVTKVHTHALDAFDSPGLGPLGVIDDGCVIYRRALPTVGPFVSPTEIASPVDIVYAWAGADARLVEASLDTGARGLVIAGLGRGNVPPAMVPGIERWMAADKPVVISSRAGRGRVGPTYGYPGAARRLVDMGVILSGGRRPQQARIDLMLALGAGMADAELRALFALG